MIKRLSKKKEDFVLVRVCIGCVLPHNAKKIGDGKYSLFINNGKTEEQYYDYEIKEKDLEDFLKANSVLLVKYQLLDVEKSKKLEEDKNPIKPTTTRGWAKKND